MQSPDCGGRSGDAVAGLHWGQSVAVRGDPVTGSAPRSGGLGQLFRLDQPIFVLLLHLHVGDNPGGVMIKSCRDPMPNFSDLVDRWIILHLFHRYYDILISATPLAWHLLSTAAKPGASSRRGPPEVRTGPSSSRRELSSSRSDLSSSREEFSSSQRDLSSRRRDLSSKRRDLSSRQRDLSLKRRDLSSSREGLWRSCHLAPLAGSQGLGGVCPFARLRYNDANKTADGGIWMPVASSDKHLNVRRQRDSHGRSDAH